MMPIPTVRGGVLDEYDDQAATVIEAGPARRHSGTTSENRPRTASWPSRPRSRERWFLVVLAAVVAAGCGGSPRSGEQLRPAVQGRAPVPQTPGEEQLLPGDARVPDVAAVTVTTRAVPIGRPSRPVSSLPPSRLPVTRSPGPTLTVTTTTTTTTTSTATTTTMSSTTAATTTPPVDAADDAPRQEQDPPTTTTTSGGADPEGVVWP